MWDQTEYPVDELLPTEGKAVASQANGVVHDGQKQQDKDKQA